MAGAVIVELQPVPTKLQELREEIERASGIPIALQKLVKDGAVITLDAELGTEGCDLLCVTDETPMFTWDAANSGSDQLKIKGGVVRSPGLRGDYCNVLTQEPIRRGIHYYEFVMHHVGDEQWCGVTMDHATAGSRFDGRSLNAWTYYCGRQRSSGGSIKDGKGALHAQGKAIQEFEKACAPGNVINMLVDADARVLAFALDGRVQGACKIPGSEALYVMTHMDTREDHVELRKPMLEDSPKEVLEALTGALLDIEKGEKLHGWCRSFDGSDEH